MAGSPVSASLYRHTQLHLGMDTAAHLVGADFCEGYAKLTARLLQPAVQVQSFTRNGDVVRRLILVDKHDPLALGDAQFFDTELQVVLAHCDGRAGTDSRSQRHCAGYAKKTNAFHRSISPTTRRA